MSRTISMPKPEAPIPRKPQEDAAPRLPLGEGASSAAVALPVESLRQRHPLQPLPGVVGVFVCGLVAFLTLYATQPLLPLFETLFHASKSAVGWTVSASTLGVAIAAPLLGTFTERANRKRVILISILLLAVPTCAAATSHSLGWLVFWRLLQGLITPGVFATTIAYITETWPPASVAPVMSIYVSGTALGGFSGRAITGVMADRLGWRAAFLLLGIVSLAGAGLVAWLLPDRPRAHLSGSRPSSGGIAATMLSHLRNKRLLTTYLVGFNVLFSLVGVFTYITFYLAAPPFSLSTTKLSELFVVYLVGLVATPLAGALLPRVGLRAGHYRVDPAVAGGRPAHPGAHAGCGCGGTGALLYRCLHLAELRYKLFARSRAGGIARLCSGYVRRLLLRRWDGSRRRAQPGMEVRRVDGVRLPGCDRGYALDHDRAPRLENTSRVSVLVTVQVNLVLGIHDAKIARQPQLRLIVGERVGDKLRLRLGECCLRLHDG